MPFQLIIQYIHSYLYHFILITVTISISHPMITTDSATDAGSVVHNSSSTSSMLEVIQSLTGNHSMCGSKRIHSIHIQATSRSYRFGRKCSKASPLGRPVILLESLSSLSLFLILFGFDDMEFYNMGILLQIYCSLLCICNRRDVHSQVFQYFYLQHF